MILHTQQRKQLARPTVIYIVRHGESSGNRSKIFQKPEEDNLNEMGKKQVELLGCCLAGEKITRIYSSDYPRALETADAIVSNSQCPLDLQIIAEKRLRERRMGNFEGYRYEDVLTEIIKGKKPILDFEAPGGESIEEVSERVRIFFEELCDDLDRNRFMSETVVIISHSFVLIKLLEYLTRSTEQQYNCVNWNDSKHFKLIQNASFVKLTVEKLDKRSVSVPDGHTIRRRRRRLEFLQIHATDHLKSLAEKDTIVKFTESTKEAKRYSGCIHA